MNEHNISQQALDETLNYSPLQRLRHSAAHIMADAVQQLFKGTRLTIGPAIDMGFYYDFDASHSFSEEDLNKIEAKMKEIIQQDLPFKRFEMTRSEALERFKKLGENYKIEIIQALPADAVITCYQHGDFIDLCRGPHVKSTGEVKAIKLLSVAGAYWRGDEKNKMLQRIYGTAFASQPALDEHLDFLREAEARDHRKLGKDLELFASMEAEGPGLILWLPKGARIRRVLEDFWRDRHAQEGYELVFTPHMAKLDLWKTSGHVEFYKENMFAPMPVEGQDYEIKPMNCPFHVLMVNRLVQSYRDLPVRLAELGTVYRYERSGVLHGLLRVRGFTQDDAHLFCTPEQLQNEVIKVLNFVFSFLRTFGFEDFEVFLSTRPQKSVGSDEHWELATASLKGALEDQKIAYKIDPGEGVFYGPKIDIKIKDVLNRSWQCSTIQVDFNNPERFDMQYVAEDGSRKRPIMIHRALMGSLERFFGILIEHYAGAFPLWLAPHQVKILAINTQVHDYALEIRDLLLQENMRLGLDLREEKLGLKIRQAQLEKVPYMIVLGEKEKAAREVSFRTLKGEQGRLALNDFILKLKQEIGKRQ
ncbi:MAG: threonine--tRNA ligase [Deltaproteobacteria bacterium]|nr:threonine--tRNA ligase [Deltaproteobacteria bacterium]